MEAKKMRLLVEAVRNPTTPNRVSKVINKTPSVTIGYLELMRDLGIVKEIKTGWVRVFHKNFDDFHEIDNGSYKIFEFEPKTLIIICKNPEIYNEIKEKLRELEKEILDAIILGIPD